MIPKAIRSHIKNGGHIVPMEKPEELNSIIMSFLDRTDI